MSHDSKTNGTERLRTLDAAAAGREDLEVIELFRVAKTKLEHTMPAESEVKDQMAGIAPGVASEAPRRMQMLETADAKLQRPGVMLPEQSRWLQMDAALRGQFRARQKRAARRRLMHPYIVAALATTILAATAFTLVMAWQNGGAIVEFFRNLFGVEPAAAVGALSDPRAIAEAVVNLISFG